VPLVPDHLRPTVGVGYNSKYITISCSLPIPHLLNSFFHLILQKQGPSKVCIWLLFKYDLEVLWSIRSTVELLNTFLPHSQYLFLIYNYTPWQSSMPMFWIPQFFFQLRPIVFMYSKIQRPVLWSSFLIFLPGFVCGSFQFVPQSSVVLPSSLLSFFHFLRSSTLLIISCVIHDFPASLSTFQPNLSQYMAHISWYCSAALTHFHFHIRLHRVFLLDYLTPSVMQHITSPNTILALPFGIVSLLQAVHAHPSYCFWIDVSQVYNPNDVDFELLVPSRCTVFSNFF